MNKFESYVACGSVENQLKAATNIMKMGKAANFTDFGISQNCFPIYPATNENLSHFYDKQFPDFANKNVLCVTGSGDHAINSVFLGAKSVETFDINQLSFFAYDLKQTALMHLSRSEFLDFYDITLSNFLAYSTYQKISPYLKKNTRVFFDGIYKFLATTCMNDDATMDFQKREEKLSRLFAEYYRASVHMNYNNPYVSSNKAYRETQKRLEILKKPVRHVCCPAHKIGDVFQPKDIVILSNVMEYYLTNKYKDDNLAIRTITDPITQQFLSSLAKVLTDDGVVSLLYGFDREYKDILKQRLNIDATEIKTPETSFSKEHNVYLAKKEDLPNVNFIGKSPSVEQPVSLSL